MLVDLFLKILNLSIGAVPLMAVLLILRLIFKKSVPRKVFYIAWALVFLRLMVPFSLESDLSIFNFVPKAAVVEENVGTSVEFIKDEGETVDFPVLVHPGRDNPNVDTPAEPSFGITEETPAPAVTTTPIESSLIFATIWIFGTAALLIFGIIGYFAVLKKLRFESVAYTDKICLSGFFKTPVVCGLFRPKIILPMNFDLDDEAKVSSVISHECTHIRRGDNFWRLLATFTLYVHWFNPLVWICYNAFIRDMEVSCDEEVLMKAKNDIRTEYAESLVALAGSGTNPLYGGVLSFGECAIKERVKCIMNFKKTTLLIVILCVAAAAALGVIFLTNPSVPSGEEVVETENYNIYGEKVAYLYDEKMNLDVTFENTGNEPLYLSFDTEISEYSNSRWVVWFNNENYSGGAQLVLPGETTNFFGMLDFSGKTSGMNYDDCLFRIRREVFSDSELKESLGFAEWIFDIETYSGIVAVGEAGEKFAPSQSLMPKETVFANEEQKAYCEEIIDNIVPEELTRFCAVSVPSDESYHAEISRENAIKIIHRLQSIELVTCEPKNPNTGGGYSFYIETLDENIAVHYNGGFFTISREGDLESYAFDAEPCTEEFNTMWKIADDVLAAALYNPNTTEPGGETIENPGEENTDAPEGGEGVPVPVGEGSFIPYAAETIAGLFCNSEKTYIPAYLEKELRELLVYANFTNFGSDAPVSDGALGKTLSGVDVVEFARTDNGKKYTLSLYENGFILSGSAVDEKEKGKVWLVENESWDRFKYLIKTQFDDATYRRAYWLGLINANNVARITVEENGNAPMAYTGENGCFGTLVSIIRGIEVKAPAERLGNAKTEAVPDRNDFIRLSVYFNTGTVYDVYITENSLSMNSSDMSYGLSYELSDTGSSYYDQLYDFTHESEADLNPATAKPVIYLYPEKETEVSVSLDFNGKLTYTYPALNNGWRVTAKPDGTLTNLVDGSTHYYLFWEGIADIEWLHEKGFVVKGSETEGFLRKTLAKMGLTPREYNDFITYWVPRMQENEYNLISFSGAEYAETAKLTVHPKPDSVIRVHMVWMALDEPINIEPQVIPTYERKGFVLVEWGGTEVFE